MCGFAGIINSIEPIDRPTVCDAAAFVSHRGPDANGLAFFNQAWESVENRANHAFFFNRLAIIDIDARSNQPFQDAKHLLLFNGEIYNYKELKNDLRRSGVEFSTSSDTEVLFFALKLWGRKALSRLNGMFALLWMDKKKNAFLLARDRTGIKPLYYKKEGNTLIFASELHSVLRLSGKPSNISSDAINSYLHLQYTPTPSTIFEDIYKLPPGNFLEATLDDLNSSNSIHLKYYWDACEYISSPYKNSEEISLEEILVDSIKHQLQADVPIGLFLSSGVDSSLLTSIVNKHFEADYYDFFTVSFESGTASDESKEASEFLKGFNNSRLRHHLLPLNPASIGSRLDRFYDYFDEPFGDPAALLNWAISEKAREQATVVLSGDGADELFWGYPRYNQWSTESARAYKKIPKLSVMKRAINTLPESWTKQTLLNMLERNPVGIYFNILRPRMYGFLYPVTAHDGLWCLKDIEDVASRNDLPAIIDLKGYLPDAMLYKVDRASMASSLEVRVPYLDNSVIDYALSLPLHEKSTRQFPTKAPLKQLLAKLAPHYDLSRPKKGFNFPLSDWLRKEWKESVLDIVNKQNLEALGLPSAPFINILHQFYNKGVNCTNEVWYIFNLILWHQNYKSKRFNRKNESILRNNH